jgi:hypothetical protein
MFEKYAQLEKDKPLTIQEKLRKEDKIPSSTSLFFSLPLSKTK